METISNSRQIEPLCKFGPGGDFVAVWPNEPVEHAEQSPLLVKLFNSAVEAMAVTIGIRRTAPIASPSDIFGADEFAAGVKENVPNAAKNRRPRSSVNPAPAPVAQDGGGFSRQPLLFPNVGRNGIRAEHKPKHRIRAYRRAAQKGPALRLAKQGSLFDCQFKSARTA